MSDLIVSSVTPTLSSGTGLRTYGVTAALARHGAVELAYVVFGARRPAPVYEQLAGVTMRAMHASRGPSRVLAYARARSRRVPADLARGVSPALLEAVQATAPDVRVIADGPVAAAALLPAAGRRELVYLAHNLESSGFRGPSGHAALVRFERSVLRSFTESWMATRADEQGAKVLAGPQISTRYVPNVVDVARIAPVAPSRAGRVLLVADFKYAPNREAFAFLAASVLPEVWQRRPDLHLAVVGRGLREPPRDARIEAPGFVEDLRAAYAAADVVAVPLLSGGGSPLKFVEALAYGLPVVATRHAARLLEDGVPDRDFLAADGAGEFGAAILALLDDPVAAARVGAAGRRLACRCYSIDALSNLVAP